jgi:glutaconate CoA-transferase subunit B
VTRDQMSEATGWDLRFADEVASTAPPSEHELETLRALQSQ